jgi:cysteine desulfurase / selenocysteine lyase
MNNIKDNFPIFKNRSNLTFLDNASTSQKPQVVIDSISQYYSNYNSNIKRGIYSLAEDTTTMYEDVRIKVAKFINAKSNEIAFTSGTTDGINFIAQSWGETNISKGDEIIVTILEHHSNFLPWQRLAEKKGAILKVVPVTSEGYLDYSAFEKLVTEKTKLIAVTYQSNVTGEVLDLARISKLAKKVEAKLFVDAAQAIAHKRVNVKEIDCDFLVFSAHKIFGPTGVGVLYIKEDLLKKIEPYQVGGGMVFEVKLEQGHTSWLKAPHKFEAGTPAIAQVIGLGVAIDFINQNIDFDKLHEYESKLSKMLIDELKDVKSVKFIVDSNLLKENHIVTFNINGFHPHDVATFLDKYDICVRAGNHCAQPLHNFLGVDSSIRVSFSIYNTVEDVQKLIFAIKELERLA